MDREAQKVLILVLLVATLIGGTLGMWGWFEAGNDTARMLAMASLLIFAPAYYIYESHYNRGNR